MRNLNPLIRLQGVFGARTKAIWGLVAENLYSGLNLNFAEHENRTPVGD